MPRFGIINSHEQDPERAQLIQAYMVLQAKQLSVQKRLQSRPSMSGDSSGSTSPELSPDEPATPSSSRPPRSSLTSPPTSPRRPSYYQRRPSVPSIPETLAEHDFASDEIKLFDINQRIKITLMELMKCESVKTDDRMRDWVKARLDAQPPLSFRRESSASSSYMTDRRKSSFNGSWTPPRRSLENVLEFEDVRKHSI